MVGEDLAKKKKIDHKDIFTSNSYLYTKLAIAR
jgi:hypothetical protein